MLRVTGLAKAYGPLRALDGVGFKVDSGSVVALLGPNGAGKTTALNCILGVISFEGTIQVDGLSVKLRGKDVRRRIGYVPQTPVLNDRDTCLQSLEFLVDLRGMSGKRIDTLLDLVNLSDQKATRVAHLSGGMRQRLALAAALVSDPPLLLLDEPTANLDAEGRREFRELVLRLRDAGKTVVLSTHVLDRLGEITDRVIVLNRGRVVFDGGIEGLVEHSAEKRFVVSLNGTSTTAFMAAIEEVGVKPEMVRSADPTLENLILATSPDRETESGGEEER
jgi:ABC-type multidrug transport system ATPase subunit